MICFESHQGIPYSKACKVDRRCTANAMVHLTLYGRASLKDKSMLLTHSYFMHETIEIWLLSLQFFSQQTDKNALW